MGLFKNETIEKFQHFNVFYNERENILVSTKLNYVAIFGSIWHDNFVS